MVSSRKILIDKVRGCWRGLRGCAGGNIVHFDAIVLVHEMNGPCMDLCCDSI